MRRLRSTVTTGLYLKTTIDKTFSKMSDLILKLEEIEPKQTSLVGGKAANLSKLIRSGINVPAGLCVTTHAYNQFLVQNTLDKKIQESINSRNFDDIQSVIRLSYIPNQLAEAITKASQQYKDLLAVRSSATAEDLPDSSFAGQHNTYLGVAQKDVLDALKKCWSSLWTKRAIEYRESMKIDHLNVLIAVIIQELIFSEVSGVMFTANPVKQSRDEHVIEATWGLGETLVSGAVNPDRFIVSKKSGQIIEKSKGKKEQMLVIRKRQLIKHTVPWLKRLRFAISKKQLLKLCEIGTKIEELFSFPQDIEWTISNKKIFVLQSRPITKTKKWKTQIF